jgi:hypothetical protein
MSRLVATINPKQAARRLNGRNAGARYKRVKKKGPRCGYFYPPETIADNIRRLAKLGPRGD